MRISKKQWEQMCRRIDACETHIAIQEEMIDEKVFRMAKKNP